MFSMAYADLSYQDMLLLEIMLLTVLESTSGSCLAVFVIYICSFFKYIFMVLFYRNGYSLYCAELMVNMKDVPSTERMVLCSKQWKMMTQKEKDMFQKRCEQVL